MARYTYQPNQQTQTNQEGKGMGFSYFTLKNNGDEAIVRFLYEDPSQFELHTVHKVKVDGKFRTINCQRTPYEDISKCPLCSNEMPLSKVFYIKLIEYVRNEQGQIVAYPKVWERGVTYADRLANLFNEYGNISDHLFKVRRSGAAGDTRTTYEVMLCANQAIYKPELYPKDMTVFDGIDLVGTAIMRELPVGAHVEAQYNSPNSKPFNTATSPSVVQPAQTYQTQPTQTYKTYQPNVSQTPPTTQTTPNQTTAQEQPQQQPTARRYF